MGQATARSSAGTIASVAKAPRVMEVVAPDPRGVTGRDIAGELGLALPTTCQLSRRLDQAGLSCLAAPARSPGGEVGEVGEVIGSVAVPLPSPEFQARRWEIERAVRTGANRVTRALRAVRRRDATVGP